MTALNSSPAGGGLGNRALLDKMDKLRELGIQELVPLPQMVVVGDQSAGKSSVLESLTGFHFPRSVTLCTRHATEIICRREETKSIHVSIQPADGDDEKAKKFRRTVTSLDAPEFERIFREAAEVMGIKSDADASGSAFSQDVLRVEISGPEEDHLTIIDVPGMFENATPGVTTEEDIDLVKGMVKKYIHESRTIILAVVPCNGDIANQKILTLAKAADPEGRRTMGVLTKPDLAVENATKEVVVDLVLGRRRDLKLGYCVVKNRGADDTTSSNEVRDLKEKEFFKESPWTRLPAERLGIPALKMRVQQLLMDRTKSEFPKVRSELLSQLKRMEEDLAAMGQSRATADQQRAYLGELATQFNRIKDQGLDAYYSRNTIFTENPELKLITRIREINEQFARVLYTKGHERAFYKCDDENDDGEDEESDIDEKVQSVNGIKHSTNAAAVLVDHVEDHIFDPLFPCDRDTLYDGQADFTIPTMGEDELDDILSEPYSCPKPTNHGQNILDHIEREYMGSRGIELGTFSGEMLPTTFKYQSKKWRPLARAHVSNAILVVHHFIRSVLERCCPDPDVLEELWNFLLDELLKRYRHAVQHTERLLDIEFEGTSMTYKPTFFEIRDANKMALAEEMRKRADNDLKHSNTWGLKALIGSLLAGFTAGGGDPVKVTRQEIHDVLHAYYDIARDRFLDVLCLHVVHHDLLHSQNGSPLNVLSHKAVLGMSADQLDTICGEDMVSRERRKKLEMHIGNLQKAVRVLRA
ncbi:P-loop containing nucleoside triphosphate hydrolase protein [Mariannaea sp. PMI_226]|nr:P-loop containing nucleoside triphosphate hydrolase protein [Mariannaea sp. PMI_226]